MNYFLVFDAGTGAGRCSIFDLRGNQIASAYQEWEYQIPAACSPNGREFSPEGFWKILSTLSRRVISNSMVNPKDILAVSTTSQREGMVFLDKMGQELYAGPNIDNRGSEMYQPFLAEEECIRKITGLGLFTLFGPARLLWFKEHDPALYDRIDGMLMMNDWIAYRLSGERSSEYSCASSSQFLDITKREWSSAIPGIFSLKDQVFPALRPAGSPIGKVTQQAANDCGLLEGTMVVAGGGDTQVGMLGIGVTEQECVSAIAGTSTPVMATIKKPIFDPLNRVSTNCHAINGVWTLESNAGMTGMSYRWVRDTFASDLVEKCRTTGEEPYDLMNDLASSLPPGAGGWKAYLGASRAGSRSGNGGGFFFPLSWILDGYDRRHLFRSALETTAFAVRANFEQLIAITGKAQSEFRVGGGQTRSSLFNSILANALNQPVMIFSVKESTSLGAALCAARGAGIYASFTEAAAEMVHAQQVIEPGKDSVTAYNDAYQEWLDFSEYLAQFKTKEK